MKGGGRLPPHSESFTFTSCFLAGVRVFGHPRKIQKLGDIASIDLAPQILILIKMLGIQACWSSWATYPFAASLSTLWWVHHSSSYLINYVFAKLGSPFSPNLDAHGVDKIIRIVFLSEGPMSPSIHRVRSWYKPKGENSKCFQTPSGHAWSQRPNILPVSMIFHDLPWPSMTFHDFPCPMSCSNSIQYPLLKENFLEFRSSCQMFFTPGYAKFVWLFSRQLSQSAIILGCIVFAWPMASNPHNFHRFKLRR